MAVTLRFMFEAGRLWADEKLRLTCEGDMAAHVLSTTISLYTYMKNNNLLIYPQDAGIV